MALPVIAKNVFPNVPDVAGVPPLDRLDSKLAFLEPANAFTSQLAKVPYLSGILQAADAESWGVFDQDSNAVIVADVFMELSQSASSKISRFFVEQGTFANYNKVDNPDETTIVMIKTGTFPELGQYISEVDDLKKSIELYDIVTPERTILNVSLESYDYARRQTEGINLIQFSMSFVEIREVALAYSEKTIPTVATSQDRGQQQTSEPKVSLLSKLQTKLGA